MIFKGNRLYQLKSKKVLAGMLEIPLTELRAIARNPDAYYEVFPIRKNGKERIVQEPKPKLKRAHTILKSILSDLPLPDYVFSGRKGLSYKDNAEVHLPNSHVVTMDIEKFFPSCKYELIERFFKKHFQMPTDVSSILAKIVCYNGHIPTGSPISQLLAYWMNFELFEKLNNQALNSGYSFSLYVDDMTFSTNDQRIGRAFHVSINRLLKNNGLKLKRSKIVYFQKNKDKVITGCILKTSKELSAPNKLKEKLFKSVKTPLSLKTQSRSALGRLNSVRYIEGKKKFQDLYKTLYKATYDNEEPIKNNRGSGQ